MHDSAWGRLISVLISPARTFQSIAARPTWAVAMIVLALLSTGSALVAWQRVDESEMTEQTREAMIRQGQEPSAEQLEQIAGFQKGMAYGCSVIVPPISYLLSALVLMAGFKIAGGEIGFPASLSATLHGMMPWAVYAILAVPVALAQQTIGFQQLQAGLLLASSAAAFLPPDASPVLLAVLGSLDVFSFWTMALLAIGFAIVAKVSRGKAAAVVIAAWLLWVVVKVALAFVGSAFGGG